MKSRFTKLALYGSTILCVKTYIVFLPISQVCNGTVSLIYIEIGANTLKSCFTYLKPCFLDKYPFFGENKPRKMAEKAHI